jgi:conjugative relaxase-like TrwC/TraI family protein
VTTMVSLRSGHDVRYFTADRSQGCAGAMAYYAKGDEPPGQWAGTAAARLGLAGQVDPGTLARLYMENIGPDGEVLAARYKGKGDQEREHEAVRAYVRAHPYASTVEVAEFRAAQRAKTGPKMVPYFDLTVSAVKSVSILHASYRVAAEQARERGEAAAARKFDERADAIEAALMDSARQAVRWLEGNATYTRTGHHSKSTGEWRDGSGLVTTLYLHHLSRDGDPQLHVHVAVWNRVQRADGADAKWRTLYGRSLYRNKLGVAPVPDRYMEQRLRDLGFLMEDREDGNGCEVAGISKAVMKRFSSRGVAIGPEVAALAAEYEQVHGKPPSKRTLWLMHQQAGQRTRRSKAESLRTVGGAVTKRQLSQRERLRAWEKQTVADEIQALSREYGQAEQAAADFARPGFKLVSHVRRPVQTEAEKERAARVAVAEAQRHHSAWGMAELRFEVHRALGAGASEGDIDEVAQLAISGRSGVGVVQVGTSPDIADVSELGVRDADGVSVYRPPDEDRWTTIGHLDLEAHIVAQARRQVAPLVEETAARRAVQQTDLTPEQAQVVVEWLTSGTATVPLNAAAGSGKSHTIGVFARLWTAFTGGKVVGVTTSTNAARVLQGELDEACAELAETYNVAQFLGKMPHTDELRPKVRLGPSDVVILDEATQAGTADVALVQQAARHAGAWFHPIGDTAQLGAVDAGGIFALLVEELGGPRLEEILRFRNEWEAAASGRIRKGDIAALAVYARRGRVTGADHEAIFDQAARAWMADYLRGYDVLLLAGSSAEAADLARRVQARLIAAGLVGTPEMELSDGNSAGRGDRIRARLNTHIEAGGQSLSNRDTLLVTGFYQGGLWARRHLGGGQWSGAFKVHAEYVAESAELDYAGNAHVAQGRTVDIGRAVVTESMSRQAYYVAATRGRLENHSHVETGATAPKGKKAFEQATVESVIKGVMDRDAGELSATATMRAGQEWASGTGHVLHLWSVAVRERLYPEIDERIKAALPADLARRYATDHAREALHARLREAQLAGHDMGELVARITADGLGGARSVAAVLHSRLEGLGLEPADGVTWAQRTPEGSSGLAHELAEGLDARARELGARHAAAPEPWLTRRLGPLPEDATATLRADYERRAGAAAAYREAAGITDPDQDVAAEPHEGNPELETARRAALRALEIRPDDERLAAMSRAQLEAEVVAGERAMAAAPEDQTERLRETAAARQNAWVRHAAAVEAGKAEDAERAKATASSIEAHEADLAARTADYEAWSARTAAEREEAGRARAELARRGPDPRYGGGSGPRGPDGPDDPDGGPRKPDGDLDLVAWHRTFESDLAKVDAALTAQREKAEAAGEPWPPPHPKAEPAGPGILASLDEPEPEQAKATTEPQPDPEPEPAAEPEPAEAKAAPPPEPGPEPEPQEPPEAEPVAAADPERTARLDEAQARAEAAGARMAAERAEEAEGGERFAQQQAEAENVPAPEAEMVGSEWEPEA